MAKFTAVEGLDEIVALMVADDVRKIAKNVEGAAKKLAPQAKYWEHRGDHRVRPEHRATPGMAENQLIPDNLRFYVPSMDWDMNDPESNHVGPITYMQAPEDWSSGGVVTNMGPCRCTALKDKNAIRKTIRTERTEILGPLVRVKVSAYGNRIIASEFGEAYDHIAPPAVGLRWMGRAAAIAAAM